MKKNLYFKWRNPFEVIWKRRFAMQVSGNKKDDPRMGDVLEKNSLEGEIVIVGFPQDEGVRRNGGRVGAKQGPEVFRKFEAFFFFLLFLGSFSERYVSKLGTVVNPEFGIDLKWVSF